MSCFVSAPRNFAASDFEPPLFSLGLEETQAPSFSLGLEDLVPPAPEAAASSGVPHDFPMHIVVEDTETESEQEDMPSRCFKRLRRGPSRSEDATPDPPTVKSCPRGSSMETPIQIDDRGMDDIEEFSSEGEPESQKTKASSYSALKFVPTPDPFTASPQSTVSVKKGSSGSKEVKLQGTGCGDNRSSPFGFATPSTSSRFERPVYEFRDNQFYVEDSSAAPSTSWRLERPVHEFRDNQFSPAEAITPDNQLRSLLRQRLPHFSFIDDLQTEGEPVYIDYRGQFASPSRSRTQRGAPSSDGFRTVEKPASSRAPKGRRPRAKASNRYSSSSSQPAPQQNVATNGRRGYWLTEGGTKVYVTAEGQRLSGKTAYKQYMKENGKLPRKSKKQASKHRVEKIKI